jgi:predicted nucleotidyltransferase
MLMRLDKYREEIGFICAKHLVKHLYVFGSVLDASFNADSDVDFLVDFQQIDLNIYAGNYFDLKFKLEQLLKRKVDLLELQAIKNPYFKSEIDRTKKLIYG